MADFTSVDRNKLQQAFGLAQKASEKRDLPLNVRTQFLAIARLIWEAHGETGVPPAKSGEALIDQMIPAIESVKRFNGSLADMVSSQAMQSRRWTTWVKFANAVVLKFSGKFSDDEGRQKALKLYGSFLQAGFTTDELINLFTDGGAL